jgi:hypothetical protein
MTLKARKDICGNCRYHAEIDGANGERRLVECRFNPPRVFMVMIPQGPPPSVLANPQGQKQMAVAPAFPAAFPMLDPEMWCGKHKPEEASE